MHAKGGDIRKAAPRGGGTKRATERTGPSASRNNPLLNQKYMSEKNHMKAKVA